MTFPVSVGVTSVASWVNSVELSPLGGGDLGLSKVRMWIMCLLHLSFLINLPLKVAG